MNDLFLSKKFLYDNKYLVRNYLRTDISKMTLIHYTAGCEVCGCLVITYSDKNIFENCLHAFVGLWKKECFYFEGWENDDCILTNYSDKEIDEFMVIWFWPEIETDYNFSSMTNKQCLIFYNDNLSEIKKCFIDRTSGDASIYVNNERIENWQKYQPNLNLDIIRGIRVGDKLHNDSILFETSTQFIMISWGTSA